MKLVSIITDNGVGGTFLAWTLHFLAGHTKYFNTSNTQWETLTDTPLTKINAHNFRPNQPLDKKEFTDIISSLVSTDSDLFHTIYFHSFFTDPAVPGDLTDFKFCIEQAQTTADKSIVVGNPLNLYHNRIQARELGYRLTDPSQPIRSAQDAFDEFRKYYFNWTDSDLTKPFWEQREQLALDIHPFTNTDSVVAKLAHTTSNYFLLAPDLWNQFDQTVYNLFDYLGVAIDSNRFKQWLPVYHEWQKLHTERQQWCLYFDSIIQAIIDGNYIDLQRFDLDMIQEATILRALLYRHNLTLKCYGLDRFTDTVQLHNLLEPNFHTIEKIDKSQ
jgi:hypothetical protein